MGKMKLSISLKTGKFHAFRGSSIVKNYKKHMNFNQEVDGFGLVVFSPFGNQGGLKDF